MEYSKENALSLARQYMKKGDVDNAISLYSYLYNNFEIGNNVKREYGDSLISSNNTKFQKDGFNIFYNLYKNGDKLAAGRLGKLLSEGRGCKQDINEAINVLKFASEHPWIKQELIKILLHFSSYEEICKIECVNHLFDRVKYIYLRTSLYIYENELSICLEHINIDEDKLVVCNLHRDGKIIESKRFPLKNLYKNKFYLDHDGIYYIDGFVGKEYRFVSYSKHFFKKDTLQFYNNILLKTCKIQVPEYYLFNYPYQDFALVRRKSNKSANVSYLLTEFNRFDFDEYTFILYNRIKKINNKNIIFSGYLFDSDNKRFIYGDIDILTDDNFVYYNKTGQFSSIIIDNNKITICNDFFGLNKIFIYDSEDFFVASNRYYLLLIILKQYNEKIKVDKDLMLYNLFIRSGMISDQIINNNLICNSTYCLELGKYIVINNDSIVKYNIDEYENIFNENLCDENQYNELIKQTSNEIYENINCLLNSHFFSEFMCDITGGIDSRLVFSVLNKIISEKEVNYICGGKKKEVMCACNLVGSYNRHFNDYYQSFIKKFGHINDNFGVDQYLDLLICLDIGTVFDPSTLFRTLKVNNLCHITGCAGEAWTRPYVNKRMINAYNDFDIDDVYNILHDIISQKICLTGTITEYSLKKFIDNISSSKLTKSLEMFLLKFRNRFHFDTSAKCSYSIPCISPLQSVSGFKLLYSTDKNFKDYKVVFDLFNEIDINIGKYEFESFKDNVDAALFLKSGCMYTSDKISDEWLGSIGNDAKYTFLTDKFDFSISEILDKMKEKILNFIIYLNNICVIDHDTALDLLYFFFNLTKKDEIISLYKKLASFAYIEYIAREKNEFKFRYYTPVTYNVCKDKKTFIEG